MAASQGIPPDPRLAVFEVIGAGGPDQNGYRLVGLFHDLEERVADGLEVAQEVFSLQPLGNLLALRPFTTGAHR